MTSELKLTYVATSPLDLTWKMTKEASCGKLMLKVLPSIFADIDILEGGAGAGTVRVVTFGEGAGPDGAGKTVKERVDVVDDATHTVSYSVVEGGDPRYTDVKFTAKFTAAGDSTSVDWSVKYTPVDPAVPPPEHFKAMGDSINHAMNAYAKEHAAEFE